MRVILEGNSVLIFTGEVRQNCDRANTVAALAPWQGPQRVSELPELGNLTVRLRMHGRVIWRAGQRSRSYATNPVRASTRD